MHGAATRAVSSLRDAHMKRVLILGATGMFGHRLAQRLVALPGITLILSSRSAQKAQALAARLGGNVETVSLDRRKNFPATLAEIKPDVMIDCSGPFQGAGFDAARASIAAGCHFIDLADARDYLQGFVQSLDELASAKNVVALAGASSTPALSFAVVRELTKGWQRVDAIDMAILPDGRNNIGRAVAEGTLSYAGRSVRVFRHGQPVFEPGWLRSRRLNLPGLSPRAVSIAETVDAEIMPGAFSVVSRVIFRAGLESRMEHHGLRAIAWLRHRGFLKDADKLTDTLLAASRLIRRFGTGDGGMQVRVRGLNAEGRWTEARWSLLARNGEGPFVPILPIVAAVKQLLRGGLEAGARLACDVIALSAITAEFAAYSISTRKDVEHGEASPFATAMGMAYGTMAPVIQAFHDRSGYPIWEGRAKVERGHSIISRFVGRLIGLPDSMPDTQVRVSVEREPGAREIWTRQFGERQFSSLMSLTKQGRLTERFGPTTFELSVMTQGNGFALPVKRAWFLGLPLPRFLLPGSEAQEFCDMEGRFNFDVRITLPLVGLLAHYQGWLKPAA